MEPGYVSVYRSGELKSRVQAMEKRLASCDICPRECHVNRFKYQIGYCHSGPFPIVSSHCAHHGEEPALSGSRGSGTIFFANCNLRCVYCQNYQISQDWKNQISNEITCSTLAQQMIFLQNSLGCHNINFVSPSHFVPQIMKAIFEAVPMGLKVPLVYNSSGYDSLDSIKQLDGIIDIYLPDLRYASDECSKKYSDSPDYVKHSRQAIKEMYRQVGNLKLDKSGVAIKGVIVRHLVLPSGLAGSEESLTWLAKEVSPDITLSIMSQYKPVHKAVKIPELSRPVSYSEYDAVLRLLSKLGMENGWIQGMESPDNYLPDFEREGHPFSLEIPQKGN